MSQKDFLASLARIGVDLRVTELSLLKAAIDPKGID